MSTSERTVVATEDAELGKGNAANASGSTGTPNVVTEKSTPIRSGEDVAAIGRPQAESNGNIRREDKAPQQEASQDVEEEAAPAPFVPRLPSRGGGADPGLGFVEEVKEEKKDKGPAQDDDDDKYPGGTKLALLTLGLCLATVGVYCSP
jgi:hypothetical protein